MAADSHVTSSATHPTTSGAAALVWRVAPDADLRWREWDDQSVVYHARSGDTHILNPLASAALKLLQKQPSTCTQIIEHVTSLYALTADGALIQQMEDCLSQFDQVGLIESSHDSE